MKVQYVTSNNRLRFEFDCADIKDAFHQLSPVQEVFEGEMVCGCCKSANVRVETRDRDGNRYYSFRCQDCYAQLDFGQTRDGHRLFKKRKDKEGNWLDNDGWYKWQGNNQQDDSPAAPPPPPAKGAYGNRR